MIDIGCTLLGGTGYGAREFLRLAIQHPHIKVTQIVSSSASGKEIGSIHEELQGLISIRCTDQVDFSLLSPYKHRFVILALPHGESLSFYANHKEEIESADIHIIDLSGDFRIKDLDVRASHYGKLPEKLSSEDYNKFIYGLSETNRENIKKATHIANPGCYPTAAILALHPLTKNFKVQSVIIDGKSGSSGAGRTPSQNFHHPELNSNAFAYKILEHRHEPEIMEHTHVHKNQNTFMFVPHVIPLSRGMMVTAYAQLSEDVPEKEIKQAFQEQYKDSLFVRIKDTAPNIRHVAGSNFCDIHIKTRNSQVVVTSCIDNLIKGMTGQAIQNINIISGRNESDGLKTPGLGLS